MFHQKKLHVTNKLWPAVRTVLLEEITGSALKNTKIITNTTHIKNDCVYTTIQNIPIPFQITNLQAELNVETKHEFRDILLSDIIFTHNDKHIQLYNSDYNMFLFKIKPNSKIHFVSKSHSAQNKIHASFQQILVSGKPGDPIDIIFKHKHLDSKIDLLAQIKNIILESLNEQKKKDFVAYLIAKYTKNITFQKDHILKEFMEIKADDINDQITCDLNAMHF
jgi:hypothetical protein